MGDKSNNSVNTRELITDMLMEIQASKEYSHILLKKVLDKYNYMNESDKAFIKRVMEGTLEHGIQIDYVLDSVSKVPVKKMKPFIKSLMRMSVYQILFMDKIPDSAACNEAVKLAIKRNFGPLRGFINGVLRNVARNKGCIQYPDKDENPLLALSIQYSMPQFLTDILVRDYGIDGAETILKGLLEERNLCVRVREDITEEEKQSIIHDWEGHDVIFKQHPYLPYAYILKNTDRLGKMESFSKGLLTVQDVSSMLVCEIADIKKNDIILDVCAAPGGKSIHACSKLDGTGLVDARDVSEYKVNLIEENRQRMHAKNLSIKVWDATQKDEESVEKADILLLDVPCSGIGVIGKKPDIKYNLMPESLSSIEVLQKRIIDTVTSYVKQGGTLIYSTCTIRKEENQDMVQYIVENYPFSLESINSYLPKELLSKETEAGYLQLLPGKGTDGFFMARLVRNKIN